MDTVSIAIITALIAAASRRPPLPILGPYRLSIRVPFSACPGPADGANLAADRHAPVSVDSGRDVSRRSIEGYRPITPLVGSTTGGLTF
jgi:hypothetical protein